MDWRHPCIRLEPRLGPEKWEKRGAYLHITFTGPGKGTAMNKAQLDQLGLLLIKHKRLGASHFYCLEAEPQAQEIASVLGYQVSTRKTLDETGDFGEINGQVGVMHILMHGERGQHAIIFGKQA
jgi:hypothetical protein